MFEFRVYRDALTLQIELIGNGCILEDMNNGGLPGEAQARQRIDVDLCLAGWVIQDRVESDRFKKFSYDELISRDKTNLDILWLKDDPIFDAADLPAPKVIAEEILASLQSAVKEIQAVLDALKISTSEVE